MQMRVFCDEFGNTGPQLLPSEQPLLLYAFLVVDPPSLLRISNDVGTLYRAENLTLAELKSTKLCASSKGLRRYEAIGRVVSETGARVCVSIVEKRYQACAMIVEAFLDPEIHEYAPPELRERHWRQWFVDACYNSLADTRLVEFLAAVRSDDPEQIANLGEQLASTLELHPDSFVSHVACRMETRPDHVFRYSQSRPGFPRNADKPASQYFAFFPALERVDEYLERVDGTATLMRDEDRQFGEPLDLAFAHGRQLDQHPGARAYGVQRQLTRLVSCTSASSKEEFGIQLADLVAGIFGRLAAAALVGNAPSSLLESAAAAWRATLITPNEHYWMLADAVLDEVVQSVLGREYCE
jgi:hypothetical protein